MGGVPGASGLPSLSLPSGAGPCKGRLISRGLGPLGGLEDYMGSPREQRPMGGETRRQSQRAACPLVRSRMCAQGLQSKTDQVAGQKLHDVIYPDINKGSSPKGVEKQRLTAKGWAGANPWHRGNLSLAWTVVLATWGMPGEWESRSQGELFLGDSPGLAWRQGWREHGPGSMGWGLSLSFFQLCAGLLGPAHDSHCSCLLTWLQGSGPRCAPFWNPEFPSCTHQHHKEL